MIVDKKQNKENVLYVLPDISRRRKRKYFIKQKLCGLIMILCGVIIMVLSADAALPSVSIIIIGIWLLFTRNEIMTFEEWSGWEDD